MARKKPEISATPAMLRTTFKLLRNQLKLAPMEQRLLAIHEFTRALGEDWHEAVDQAAQASGRTYQQQMAIIDKELPTWQAQPPSNSSSP